MRGFRIEEVQRAIDVVLGPHGFLRAGPIHFADDDHGFDEWVRENSWRRDIFGIGYRGGRTPERLAASVTIKLLPAGGEPISFDSADVAFLARRAGVLVWYPGRQE